MSDELTDDQLAVYLDLVWRPRPMTTTRVSAMDEDELLAGITGALSFGGWRWHHIRRSDQAVQQGSPGFPDILAVKDGRLVAWELKSETGYIGGEQLAWVSALARVPGVDARILRPSDYTDELLRELLGDRLRELRRAGQL
jgi:hypothetical protein